MIYGGRCRIPLPLPPLGHRTATARVAFFPFAPLHPARSPSPLGANLALGGPLSGSLASSGGRGRARLHMSSAGPFSRAAPGLGHLPFPLGSSKVFLHFRALHVSRVPNQINHSHSCASFEEAGCLRLVRQSAGTMSSSNAPTHRCVSSLYSLSLPYSRFFFAH